MKNKKIFIYGLSTLALVGIGVGSYLYFNNEDNKTVNIDKIIKENTVSVIDEDSDIDFSKYSEEEIKLDNKSVTISKGGIYKISGSISNGNIIVNTEENVKLILNGVSITNSSGPAILIENAKNTVIELVDGTVNTLTDGENYTNNEYDGCLYSADDLIISGSGKLVVNGKYMDGIVSKDDLKIVSGIYEINVSDDGIRGKDSVYIVDGEFSIKAGGDGIKATNDAETDKGNIRIDGGTFKIEVDGDGIQAEQKIIIENGTYDIKTGNGATVSNGKMFGTTNANSNSESAKGIKAGNNLVIYNGEFVVNTSDDGIHTDGDMVITNGNMVIKSSDDGIHADGMITIDGGTFEITAAEGIEATYVKINNGEIKISASDDGINAGNKSKNYDVTIEINGGNITINMGQGDTDAIDANGNIYINGGTVNITANSPFDYDGEAKLTGGKLIVNGTETKTITNQMMGGGMNGGMNGNMPQDGNMKRGNRGGMNRY